MASTSAAARISEIDDILAGPRVVSIGDRSITYDFAQLRKERARLMRADSATSQYRRVVFKNA